MGDGTYLSINKYLKHFYKIVRWVTFSRIQQDGSAKVPVLP